MRTRTRRLGIWTTLLVLYIASNVVAKEIIISPDRSNPLNAAQWTDPRPITNVFASPDSSIGHAFFPLHMGDRWVYGYFCTYYFHEGKRIDPITKQEGTLTRVITHIDTIRGLPYYITQDIYQPDSTSSHPPTAIVGVVHSNYRIDANGNVYAYEPRFGVELLVFRLNARPWLEDSDRWLEYEGELPERYLEQLGLWWKENSEDYGYQPKNDYMVFSKRDPLGYMSYGGAVLRRGIGIVSVSLGGDLPEVECSFRLFQAVIDGQEYVFSTTVQQTTWGNLKGSFSEP